MVSDVVGDRLNSHMGESTLIQRCPIASFNLGSQVSNKLLFHCNLSHSLIKGSRIHKTYQLKAGFGNRLNPSNC